MPHWLDQRAHLTPGRKAVSGGGESWTFQVLATKSKQTARQLVKMGVRRGDHVALLLGNGLHTVCVMHALSYLGAVMVPLNTRLAVAELGWQLTDSEASVLVYDEKHREQAKRLKREGVVPSVISWDRLTSLPEEPVLLRRHLSLEEVHTIMYTSGTTGHPKGVMLTYGNHWWSAVASALNLGLRAEDRWLVGVPMFHMSGLSILMRSVIYGMTAVIQETFDPAEANRAILHDGITHVSAVAVMLTQMMDNLGERRYPDSFRCMLLGGGPAPKPLLEKARERKIPVFQTYGMTETASQIVTLAPEDSLRKLGSAGKVLFPAEIRILEGKRECAAGEPGEITVRGPNVTRGYWKRAEATEQVIREGWLRTGDIGYLDEEGFLYVLDRRSDLIISGGENVYPAEVEAVLLSHPAVEEAGVAGVPDQRWGQAPVGFVKPGRGTPVEGDELIRYCQGRLARYKVPTRIVFVEELPRNASGKLIRRSLPDRLSKGGEGDED
ncbi:o-succinylbenzoate--CoA ligase [Paludifilum halophilum]|uniref:2-succinylbenzoate--CoA ligase n=2 Tax=Paludifilum halophilum TaxID=1642702 RepID=A0A235B4X7_9BACL|nr:o-succinylbenzoate--CoA ligase [Paludifilum halophilum]